MLSSCWELSDSTNAQVFGTGTDFGFLLAWVAAGVVLYPGVLPALPSMVAGWRCFGKRMGALVALAALYGFLIAIGLAAVIAPWAYLRSWGVSAEHDLVVGSRASGGRRRSPRADNPFLPILDQSP